MRRWCTLLAIAALVTMMLPLSTAAQADPPPGPTSRYTSRAEGVPISGPYEIVTFILEFAPGTWTPVHQHGGQVFSTIIDGELTFRKGGTERVYRVGEGVVELPDEISEVGNPSNSPAVIWVTALLPAGVPLTTVAGSTSPNPPPGPVARYMHRTAGAAQTGPFEIVQFLLDFASGQTTPPHTHGGVVMSTVLAGELTDRTFESGTSVFPVGANFIEHPGDAHQVSNASAQLTTLGVSAVLPKGNPLSTVLPSLSCQYFTETKHSLCLGFQTYWAAFGGLAVYGYPITEEFTDDSGTTVQWFERARFEWRPGSWPERYDVLLGRIGAELATMTGVGPTP